MQPHVISIYAIRQISTGIVYVGSSVHTRRRWYQHRSDLKKGCHHAPWLQRAWTKHGTVDFEFELLEVRETVDGLIEREVYWLAQFDRTFNNAQPDSSRGVFVHGEETKQRMSESQRARFAKTPMGPLTEDHMKRFREGKKNHVFTPEQRMRMSIAAKARPPVSDETRERLRQANYRRIYSPLSVEHKALISDAHRGKALSEEHRKRISAGLLAGRYAKPEEKE